MPRPVNRLQITGNLTDDPKITVINKGEKPITFATFSLAFDWWNGHKLSPAWFFNCVAFGHAAMAAEKFLKKGYKIIVTDSYIQQDKYVAKDGTKKSAIKIVVNDFNLLALNKSVEGKDIDAIEEQMADDIDDQPF